MIRLFVFIGFHNAAVFFERTTFIKSKECNKERLAPHSNVYLTKFPLFWAVWPWSGAKLSSKRFGRAISASAVSYTHLDVYKRQVQKLP